MVEDELETLCIDRTVEARLCEAWEEKMKAQEDAIADHDTELE